jgi:CubicO group peptidase (beta-lactamase class C family)
MDSQLSAAQQLVRDAARRFAREELAAVAAAIERSGGFEMALARTATNASGAVQKSCQPTSMLRVLVALSLAIALSLVGCAGHTVAKALPDSRMIDRTARTLMQREHVQGLALAVIDNGQVVHVATYRIRDAAGDPLTTETIMYGASLTKTAFTYLVMQLVDEGRLNLDTPIANLLPRPLPEYDDYHDLARADGFREDGKPEPHDERSSVSAAGSMDTDVADQARL